MNCYSVSPHSFYYFFSKLFVDFIFLIYIELVENYSYSFSHKILWIATVFPHMVFFCFFKDFFQNCICRFYFFNIEMVENLALYFFSLKHCGLL